jgi:hypothetical protein
VPLVANLLALESTDPKTSPVPYVKDIGKFFSSMLKIETPTAANFNAVLGLMNETELKTFQDWATRQYAMFASPTHQPRYSLRPALMSVFNGYLQMYYNWLLSGQTNLLINFIPLFKENVCRLWSGEIHKSERAEDVDPDDLKPFAYNKDMPKDIFNAKSQQMEPVVIWDMKTPLHKQREIDYDTIDALQEKYHGENMVRKANPSAYLAPNPLSNSYYEEEDGDGPVSYPELTSSSSSYRNRIPSSRGMRPPSWPALKKGWKPMRRSQMQRDDNSPRPPPGYPSERAYLDEVD